MKLHREVFELQITGQLSGAPLLLYQWLAFHADCRHRVGTGCVKALSVSGTAAALRCNRSTVHRSVGILADLGLFEPSEDGNCLAGILPLLAAPKAPERTDEESAPKSAPRVTPETEEAVAMAAAAAHNRREAARAVAEAAAQSAQRNGAGTDSKSYVAALRDKSGV